MKLLTVACFGLAMIGTVWSAEIRIPDHPLMRVINGKNWYSGELYLTAHDDTMLVKKRGFRRFEFLGRSVGTVRYHAWWPVTVKLDSLPPELHDISFDVVPPVNSGKVDEVDTAFPDTDEFNPDPFLNPDPLPRQPMPGQNN